MAGIIEWPCPRCGNAQKSRDLAKASTLCASCQENFESDLAHLESAKHLAKKDKARKREDIFRFYGQSARYQAEGAAQEVNAGEG